MCRFIVSITCLILLLPFFAIKTARAQGTDWGEPVNISNSSSDSLDPSIAVDPSGVVHVVWYEKGVGGEEGGAIYYASFDGNNWSNPVDILIPQGQNATVQTPVIASDQFGRLHLVWIGGFQSTVSYSQAYAPEAGSAKNWRTPAQIGDAVGGSSSPDLAIDRNGGLHVVYAVRIGERSGVYYSYSSDDGRTWSTAQPVFINLSSNRMVDHARLAVDKAGDIHIVWTEYDYPDTFPPLGIRYAQSTDGGRTWTPPLNIDGPYDNSGIAVVGEKQVHLVWSGTHPDRYKFHRWSNDGGLNWSSVVRTSESGGYQGWSSLAVDSDKNVHLIQSWGAGVEVLGHRTWNGLSWLLEERLMTTPTNLPREIVGTGASPEYPDSIVGLGNELHVVVKQFVEYRPGQWAYDIFYMKGQVESEYLQPVSLPPHKGINLMTSVNELAPLREKEVSSQSTPLSSINKEINDLPNNRSMNLLIVGIFPPSLFLICVIAFRVLKRR